MPRVNWKDFVTVDPDYHHGEPCIKGTRVPLATIVGSLADGMTTDDILAEYPQITPEAVRAAVAYAAEVVSQETILPLAD